MHFTFKLSSSILLFFMRHVRGDTHTLICKYMPREIIFVFRWHQMAAAAATKKAKHVFHTVQSVPPMREGFPMTLPSLFRSFSLSLSLRGLGFSALHVAFDYILLFKSRVICFSFVSCLIYANLFRLCDRKELSRISIYVVLSYGPMSNVASAAQKPNICIGTVNSLMRGECATALRIYVQSEAGE